MPAEYHQGRRSIDYNRTYDSATQAAECRHVRKAARVHLRGAGHRVPQFMASLAMGMSIKAALEAVGVVMCM